MNEKERSIPTGPPWTKSSQSRDSDTLSSRPPTYIVASEKQKHFNNLIKQIAKIGKTSNLRLGAFKMHRNNAFFIENSNLFTLISFRNGTGRHRQNVCIFLVLRGMSETADIRIQTILLAR